MSGRSGAGLEEAMKTITTALILVSAWAVMGMANSQPITVFPGADWEEATPESQGVDSAKLKGAVAYMDENFGAEGARQLVIIRNGTLIWKGPDADAYHELYSATKVFTSTILGLLIGDGKCTLDTLAVEHLPELDDRHPAYAKIKLRHLASMTGGYRGKVANVVPEQKWGDPVVYVTTPDTPEFEPSGSQVAYNDHDVHLLGRIMATRLAKESLKDLFKRRIADPIGMTRWDWGICGTIDGMTHYNAAGTPALKGNGGIQTTPRELPRVGLLYLNRGNWKGKQLLPASFVEEASATQVPATMPGRSRSFLSGAYGFYWWTNGLMANGKRRYLSAPPGTYAAHGASTNFCFVIPEWNMVVVRMGQHSDLRGTYVEQDQLMDTFFAKLAQALTGGVSVPHRVTSFTLINADTGQPIPGCDPLKDGATLDLAALPTRKLNLRADTEPARVGSVRFGYDGNANYQTENGAPYTLAGDVGGKYTSWTPSLGQHTVSATPFAGVNASGGAGTPLTIRFIVEDTGSKADRAPAMAFPGRDWREATPESQGVDSARLKAAVDYLHETLRDYGGAGAMVIVRNGYLIWNGPECDVTYQIFSATKSFTSTCLGLLIDDGKASLDTLVRDYAPSLAKQYPTVTLRHFATMTSGYDGATGGYERDGEGRSDSWVPDPPAAPIFLPGTRFRYWDEAMMQFGNALAKIAGEPLDQLLKRRVGDPIGMTRMRWDAGNWTGGIHTTARELARYGHLFLNRGNWNGRQLVSASWVDQATSVQVPTTIPNDNLPRSRGAGVYGYNWWVNGVKPDGKPMWPDATPKTYYANGLHANVCIVIPEWSMVIARTNGPAEDGGRNSPENIDEVWNTFLGKVGEAVVAIPHKGKVMQRKTEVSIRGEAFYINGRPTYAGRRWQDHKIEGLLFNSRMVQGIFDDLNPETRSQWAYPDTGVWDAERNSREFLAAMPEWRRHGLLAFTLNLQGGNPRGYGADQPWHNSALTENGFLRPDYMARLERILNHADELGMVVILGIFYFGQDQRLKDEAAVVRGLDAAVEWVLDRGYRNALIEVNNECNVRYDHAILKPERVHELIERAKSHQRNGRRLLVSTSYGGGTIPHENVIRSADFLLLHGNGVSDPERLAEMVRETRRAAGYRPMPILFNEDDHFDFEKPRNNLVAAVGEYASWGYFDFRMKGEGFDAGYQSVPVNWGISSERKRAFFAKVKEITGE